MWSLGVNSDRCPLCSVSSPAFKLKGFDDCFCFATSHIEVSDTSSADDEFPPFPPRSRCYAVYNAIHGQGGIQSLDWTGLDWTGTVDWTKSAIA